MEIKNLNGKMLLVPMSKIGEEFAALIEKEDGMQNVLGVDIFVYATGNMPERHCCCGGRGGHHHHEGEEGEHHCCGGHHHHEGEEGEHHCCGGHHHEGEEGEHHCCGGHHHEGEEGEHHCCGGHHHEGEEGEHHCCGGHHHHEEEEWDDMCDEDYADEDEGYELDSLMVIDEPLVMMNTHQAHMLGVEVDDMMYYAVPEEGLTLVPAASLEKEGFIPTGPITIRMEE
ncbi:MAG: hypothetical protein II371_05550 [Flavobacteriales bacterium]|nr:hypothetical protein [Flavobacteriales bacterium]MBQ2421383.1 hypothetical protein [Flavobacteriales bacterium]